MQPMALEKVGTFVLTDDTLDAHSERVIARGVDISRFKSNPVMLYNHIRSVPGWWDDGGLTNDTILPIGKWQNIKKTADQITADAYIDMEDEFASKIGKKVAAGIISAVSIGYKALAYSDDPEDKVQGQKGYTITKAELLEASLVDIPANPNALIVSKQIDQRKSDGKEPMGDKSSLVFVKTFGVIADNEKMKKMEKKNLFEAAKTAIKAWFGKDVSSEDEAAEFMQKAELPQAKVDVEAIKASIKADLTAELKTAFTEQVKTATDQLAEQVTGLVEVVAEIAKGQDQQEESETEQETQLDEMSEALKALSQQIADLKGVRTAGNGGRQVVAVLETTKEEKNTDEGVVKAKKSLTEIMAEAKKRTTLN